MKATLEITIEYDAEDRLWCVSAPGIVSPSSTLCGAFESFGEYLAYDVLESRKPDEPMTLDALRWMEDVRRIDAALPGAPWGEECQEVQRERQSDDPEEGEYTPGEGCPLPDADEYDRAFIVRGIEMFAEYVEDGLYSMGERENVRLYARLLIQEVRDGKQG